MMELTASQPVLINRGMLYLDWNLGDPTPWGHHLASTSRLRSPVEFTVSSLYRRSFNILLFNNFHYNYLWESLKYFFSTPASSERNFRIKQNKISNKFLMFLKVSNFEWPARVRYTRSRATFIRDALCTRPYVRWHGIYSVAGKTGHICFSIFFDLCPRTDVLTFWIASNLNCSRADVTFRVWFETRSSYRNSGITNRSKNNRTSIVSAKSERFWEIPNRSLFHFSVQNRRVNQRQNPPEAKRLIV